MRLPEDIYQPLLFECAPSLPKIIPGQVTELMRAGRSAAIEIITRNHYLHSVPSGKSHYLLFDGALVVWAIPANQNIASFLLGWPGTVWELARLYAPDGHEKNLLTRAISAGVREIQRLENPDALVSYADPNVGHHGGVYRAASWIYHGQCEDTRTYQRNGCRVARRAFHSGVNFMRKAEIEAAGWEEIHQAGKHRFVKPLTRKARKVLR